MDFVIFGALAFALTLAGMFAFKPLANYINLIDHPKGRKQHAKPTPMHGGLAIYTGVMLSLLFSNIEIEYFLGYFSLCTALLIIGIIDDINDTSAKVRFALQICIASVAVIYFDVRIQTLGEISPIGTIELGILSYPFTIFCFIAAINAINMIDGLDGLAGSLVLIPALLLGLILIPNGNTEMALVAIAISAGCLAFLTQNAPIKGRKAKAFMGDSGSTLIGFSLAWMLIEASQSKNQAFTPVSALWFLAIPLIDSGVVILKRAKEGRSPMSPGRDHIHHLLLRHGLTEKQTFSLLALSCITICLAQLGLIYLNAWESISILALLAGGAGYFRFASKGSIVQQPELLPIESKITTRKHVIQSEKAA